MCEACGQTEDRQKFYITTPIYYPSDKLHIGHSYTTVAADTMARYKRAKGFDVLFLTGTDEHGQKIEKKAQEQGKTPKAFVDEVVAGIKDLWALLDISYDRFIRTTDEQHERCVQAIFTKLYEQGTSTWVIRGWYCTPCESFGPIVNWRTMPVRTADGRYTRLRRKATFSAFRSIRIS